MEAIIAYHSDYCQTFSKLCLITLFKYSSEWEKAVFQTQIMLCAMEKV